MVANVVSQSLRWGPLMSFCLSTTQRNSVYWWLKKAANVWIRGAELRTNLCTFNATKWELFVSSLCVISFRRQFLPMCLVYDFSLNDLLAPSKDTYIYIYIYICDLWWTRCQITWMLVLFFSAEKQRTLTVLSAIMNFLHFRKQRMDMTLEKQAKFVCSSPPHKSSNYITFIQPFS